MIFAGIATVDGLAGICTGPVRTDHFPAGRIFQVYQLFLIEFDIAHNAIKIGIFDEKRKCKIGRTKLAKKREEWPITG